MLTLPWKEILIVIGITVGLATVMFVILGACGGLSLLLLLNGFSESKAMPIIGGYALGTLGITVGLSSAVEWWVLKKWSTNFTGPFWPYVILNLVVVVVVFVVGLGVTGVVLKMLTRR